MTTLENPQNERTTWTYDNLGRTTERQLANGSKATYTYDAARRLTRLANVKSDDSVISSFDYSHDKVGNRTAVLEANGDRVTWSYDNTYQLTREQRSGANAYDVTHSYDASGNLQLQGEPGTITGGERSKSGALLISARRTLVTA